MFISGWLAFLFLALTAAGCTSTVRRDVGTLEGRVSMLEGTVGQHDAAIGTLTGQQQETARLLAMSSERLEKNEGRTEEAHKRVDALQAETYQKLAAIERRVTGLRSATSTLNVRMGVVEDAGGLDGRVRAFRISGFRAGSSEVPPGWQPDGVKKALADGYLLKAVVGFADAQCPNNGDCERMNGELATARAKAVAAALDPQFQGHIYGRGSTDRFGEIEANRSVVVYLERDGADNVYTPLRGPVGPMGSQGIEGDPGPAGPPGDVTIVTALTPSGVPPAVVNPAPASPTSTNPPTSNP